VHCCLAQVQSPKLRLTASLGSELALIFWGILQLA
jgi:hypothetical protein